MLQISDLDINGSPILIPCGKCNLVIPKSQHKHHFKMCGIKRINQQETRERFHPMKVDDKPPNVDHRSEYHIIRSMYRKYGDKV